MGQYHMLVNLDKGEYINPHQLGAGLKLGEQLGTHPGTGAALIILLASASNGKGGGDLDEHPFIGHWRGERIAMVGDYDDDTQYNIAGQYMSGAEIYRRCHKEEADALIDVSDAVCAILEAELGGKFSGDGWRDFTYGDGEKTPRAMRPDMILTVSKV